MQADHIYASLQSRALYRKMLQESAQTEESEFYLDYCRRRSVDGLSGLVQSWMDKGSNFRIEFYRKEMAEYIRLINWL